MTLWQEQRERPGTASTSSSQHLSRREARDAERRANETGDLSGVHPSGVYDLNSSGNIWDTLSRRAASQLTEAATEAERRTGRRVSDTDHPSEPLSYITQGRPQVPTYDSRRPAAPVYGAERSAQPRSFAPHEDTRTRPTTRIDMLLAQAAPVQKPELAVDESPALDLSASIDHTMTRRELRAIRETGQAPSLARDRASGAWMPTWQPEPVRSAAPILPAPAAPAAAELAGTAFSAYTDTATVEMAAIDRAAIAAEVPVMVFPDDEFEEPDTATVAIEQQPEAKAAHPVRSAPLPAPAPGTFTAPIAGLKGFEALIAQAATGLDLPTVAAPEPQLQPQQKPVRDERPYAPPAGHWSVQAAEPEDALPFEGMLSRNIGTPSGSTNALIMSRDPQPDLFSAVNRTGEIMITGSMDLPRILSSTGAPSDQYDSSEIDRLFEASQDDHHTADVMPVRAARAVATHTSTRSVVSPRKRRGAMLPTALAITAALMALGVVGLLFAGYVLRIF